MPVSGEFQTSPFPHHLTAPTCLSLAGALYQHAPSACLLSVRGYEFGFTPELSQYTAALLPVAVDQLMDWLADVNPAVQDQWFSVAILPTHIESV